MKTHRISWLALLGLAMSPGFAEPPALTICYYDRLPYYGDVNGQAGGILVEITRLVVEEAGVPYRFVKTPPKRILNLLKEQPNTCAIGWFKNAERSSSYTFSQSPIYQDKPFHIVVAAGKRDQLPASFTLQELLGSALKLGVIDGFIYGDWLDGQIARSAPPRMEKINLGDDSENLYRMILGKRIDYIFVGGEEGSYALKTNPDFGRSLALLPVADAPMGNLRYLMFSRGVDAALLDKINAAIPKVKAGEKYKQILRQLLPHS